MTLEEAHEVEARTKVMFNAQVWDFGYVSATGHCIIYKEGKWSMQDAVHAEPKLVELETVARARMARMVEEQPTLPPTWEWHPWNGREDVQIKWRALGPEVSGRRLEAYGKLKHEDTPAGCARKAWEIWERLSGLRRADTEKPTVKAVAKWIRHEGKARNQQAIQEGSWLAVADAIEARFKKGALDS